MSYGYVYVAQVAQGANQAQLLKALLEAESYHGPSLIIAYAPCINHGIKKGMAKAQTEEELAVKVGYWHNFRFKFLQLKETSPLLIPRLRAWKIIRHSLTVRFVTTL